MEDGRAVGCELSQGSLRSPIDEDVSARENLCAALRLGKEVVGGEVARNQLGCPRGCVEPENLATARRRCMNL
jgi:hypothetical protein